MNKTEYKNKFNQDHYERIPLVVPKGMKKVIKDLASKKGLSVNAYFLGLVHHDQEGIFDKLQISDKNKEYIRSLHGNMHDGYDIMFKDGHVFHCRTKLDVRKCVISYLAQDSKSLAQDT
ncbi:MAG: hypothetical protein RR681_00810 [Lachnospiraceae bacterium]